MGRGTLTTAHRPITVLGLMSGTSMDGVDACLARIALSGRSFQFEILDSAIFPYEPQIRTAISDGLTGSVDDLAALHFRLGRTYADIATRFLGGRALDLVGCHGQTVAHSDGQSTLQLGSPAPLARELRAPVVSGFREADLAAGGNGAPLMPFLDWLIGRDRPGGMVTLNLGGVANITAIPPDGDRDRVVGFDTGPGMGLIDEAADLLFDSPMDEDGRDSLEGTVQPNILAQLMAHPYIQRQPPKSTGRDEFGRALVEALVAEHQAAPADLLRTLVAFTAKSVAFAIGDMVKFEQPPDGLIASGGGVHHPLVLADLQAELPGWQVVDSQELGIDPDHKESLLMAVLAVAHIQGLPGNFPGVTGAGKPVVLGNLTPVP